MAKTEAPASAFAMRKGVPTEDTPPKFKETNKIGVSDLILCIIPKIILIFFSHLLDKNTLMGHS